MDEKAIKLLEEIRDEIRANREYSAKLLEDNRKKVFKILKWGLFAAIVIGILFSFIFR